MLKKFKELTQGHTANKWWSTNWNPSVISELSPISELMPNYFTKYVSLTRCPASFVTKLFPTSQPTLSAFPQVHNHYPYPHHLLTLHSSNCKLLAVS